MNKKIFLSFAVLMFSSLQGYTGEDINNANNLSQNNIIVDRSSNPDKYRLDDTITRAEVVGIALTLNKIQLSDNHSCKGFYTDVTKATVESWICRAVEVAAANNIISTENKNFQPNKNISRAEAFAILYSASKFQDTQKEYDFYYTQGTTVEWQSNLFKNIQSNDLDLPDTYIESSDASFVFPVEEPYNPYSDTFGAPRHGGRTHIGTDIIAKKMTKLLAVTDGKITFAPNQEPYWGYALHVKGDNGYTYKYLHVNNDTPGTDDGNGGAKYAYAPGIRKGSRVKAGDHIGYLGDSGNAEWTSPHLHFEITSPSGQVINPYNTLKNANRSGTPVTWYPNRDASRAEIFAFANEIFTKKN